MPSFESRLVNKINQHIRHQYPLFYQWLAIILAVSVMVIVALITVLYAKVEVKQEKRSEGDRVWNLPGQPPVKFPHYAGYITLGPGKDEKALFYWFFEAEEGASQKPLVLWLNGGNGCSSVAIGAIQELGPFLVRGNGTQLVLNEHSWNRAANILFLEAPVGVSFSYTNKSEDLQKIGDAVTADDSHSFLINWFKRFPSFKSHDFYIAGESYAGHFVPQLAELVYERNKGAPKDSYINLKGFMLGNPVINDPTDTAGMVDFAWRNGMISNQLYHSLKKCIKLYSITSECYAHYTSFVEAYTKISIYSISVSIDPFIPALSDDLGQMLNSEVFFNRKDVQQALHANITKLPYPYSQCSNVIKRWNDSPKTVLPILNRLLAAGLRIWMYSGDKDGRVPVQSTMYGINEMGLKRVEKRRTWFYEDQVAGWVEIYKGGLVLATVRGAGHQVPVFAPQQSLSLFSHFLSDSSLPATPTEQ